MTCWPASCTAAPSTSGCADSTAPSRMSTHESSRAHPQALGFPVDPRLLGLENLKPPRASAAAAGPHATLVMGPLAASLTAAPAGEAGGALAAEAVDGLPVAREVGGGLGAPAGGADFGGARSRPLFHLFPLHRSMRRRRCGRHYLISNRLLHSALAMLTGTAFPICFTCSSREPVNWYFSKPMAAASSCGRSIRNLMSIATRASGSTRPKRSFVVTVWSGSFTDWLFFSGSP